MEVVRGGGVERKKSCWCWFKVREEEAVNRGVYLGCIGGEDGWFVACVLVVVRGGARRRWRLCAVVRS